MKEFKDKSLKFKKPLNAAPSKRSTPSSPVYWLMMAYLFIPVLLYGFDVLDSNGPKFLAIAGLNLIGLGLLVFERGYKPVFDLFTGFFRRITALFYLFFFVISALSVASAVNTSEALMNFSRTFIVFAAVLNIWMIFRRHPDYLIHLVVAMNLLLLFDSASVFYNVIMFAQGDLASIMDIRSVYAHKNVLAAAIFVKLPAVLYLIFYRTDKIKWLAYSAGTGALIAILILSARAFYLGLVVLFLALLAFTIVRFFKSGKREMLFIVLKWAGFLIGAVLIYSVVQALFFPKGKDMVWNTDVISRLSTLRADESSTQARLNSWSWSLKLIGEEPLTGVGTGNWKIRVLKYENQIAPDFQYSLKAHNDFLETTAETGIPGGVAYILVFGSVFFIFIRANLRKDSEEEQVRKLFVPALGFLAYLVDAMINFPADRPEMQALFALYLGMFVAFSGKNETEQQIGTKENGLPGKLSSVFGIPFTVFLLTGMVASIWLQVQNNISLHYQLVARQELFNNVFRKSSAFFENGFPAIPNLTCLGEPINVVKAKYLVNEEKYRETIEILKIDHSSPWDSRKSYFLSMAYDKLGMPDSAIFYGMEAYRLQPYQGKLVTALSSRLFLSGDKMSALKMIKQYLSTVKTNPEAYLLAAEQYYQIGKIKKAWSILDSGSSAFQSDTSVNRKARLLRQLFIIYPYADLYDSAKRALNSSRYIEALSLYNEFISRKPRYADAYGFRALCYFHLGKYLQSVEDINQALKLGLQKRYDLINLRGINLHKLGRIEEGCQDFKLAMDNGNSQASGNYKKYCLKK